jgi:pimeloyl-ACP methyl ester carboxylesterase
MRPIWIIPVTVITLLIGCAGNEPSETPSGPELANGAFDAVVDGRTIHYEVHGTGPVVLALTNSWGLSLDGLRGLFKPLEAKLTVVTFDPRGMGGSSPVTEDADMSLAAVREDFDALRRHLGLDRVNAIGWSNGATNLILLASERPDTISSAIFVHGAASFGPADMAAFAQHYPELAQHYVAFQQEMADPSLTDDERTSRMREVWLGEYFPAITADPETAAPRIQAAFADAQLSWPHAQFATRESPAFDYTDRLGAITARSLVIAGAHDSLPPERVRIIADGIPDAEFELFASSGHFAPLEEPDAFAASVFAFLGVE